jgi:hypothetical protein
LIDGVWAFGYLNVTGKRMRKLAVAVAAILMLSTSANAAYMSGNTLLVKCEGTDLDQITCMAYIVGVADAQSGLLGGGRLEPTTLPAGVQPGQLKAIVVKYLKEHPEMLHFEAAQLIYIALGRSF